MGKERDLAEALSGNGLRIVFQPIVSLKDRRVVGHEALARGPAGSSLESPLALFDAARAAGETDRLDWMCRKAAIETHARQGGHGLLFLNVEPNSMGTPCPDEARDAWERARRERVVLEMTERAIAEDPGALMAGVSAMKNQGWGFALDDVGADSWSLALQSLLAPDVVKLDLRLIQAGPTVEIAKIVNAVRAYRERNGIPIVAEGIETEAHREAAIAMGATLGQGWLFGRPQERQQPVDGEPVRVSGIVPMPRSLDQTPFEVVAAQRGTEPGAKPLLLAMSHQLEDQAAAIGDAAVVLAAFQTASRFTPATRRRYRDLGRGAALVAALGVGLSAEPVAGVRGAEILPDDPLVEEWSVIVLGQHFGGALVARDRGEDGADKARMFDFAVTYDRRLVAAAARTLMLRLAPIKAG